MLAHVLGGTLGGTLRGEQAQGAALRGLAQFTQTLQLTLVHTKSRRLQIPGNVHDALLAVVERRTHVDTRPARRALALQPQGTGGNVKRVAHRQGRTRQNYGAVSEQAITQLQTDAQRSDIQGRRVGVGSSHVAAVLPAALTRNPQYVLLA